MCKSFFRPPNNNVARGHQSCEFHIDDRGDMHIKIYVFEGADYEYHNEKFVGTNIKRLFMEKYEQSIKYMINHL